MPPTRVSAPDPACRSWFAPASGPVTVSVVPAALREMVMFDQVSSRPSARRGTIWNCESAVRNGASEEARRPYAFMAAKPPALSPKAVTVPASDMSASSV